MTNKILPMMHTSVAGFSYQLPLRALMQLSHPFPHISLCDKDADSIRDQLQAAPCALNLPDPCEGIQQISSCISSVIQHLVKGEYVII